MIYVPLYKLSNRTFPVLSDAAVSFTVVPSELYKVNVAPGNVVPEVEVFVKVNDFGASSELMTLLLGSVKFILQLDS